MKALCDLHTHSVYSDGTCSPVWLVEEAERIGLSAIALTDHNTVAGLPEFLAAAEDKAVEAIPGIEFSTDYQGRELHILALYLRPCSYDEITAMMEDHLARKERSNLELIDTLGQLGYRLDYPKIKAATPKGQVNRAHIAAELTALGYMPSVKAAFDSLLAQERGYFNPPKRMTAFETIHYIHSIGAVSVLAHPFLNLKEEQLRTFLKDAVPCGLDAMETVYSTYDAQTAQTAKKIAEEFGLLESGGSDFHGRNKPDISLGCGRGALQVPLTILEQLKSRKAFLAETARN